MFFGERDVATAHLPLASFAVPTSLRSPAMNAPEKLPSSSPAAAEPHVMKTYGRLLVALSHGKGCWVWDTEGRKYLDGLGGIAVNTLGHDHPRFVFALHD